MLRQSQVVVIWNASAGSADAGASVRERLEAIPDVTLLEPDDGDAAVTATRRAANEGAELIVAGGGDGTVRAVIAGLLEADADAALGILPLGTGNDLARTLAIPLSPDAAFEVLSSGNVQPIDIVRFTSSTGPSFCANMLTGGNTGKYLRHMTDEIKHRWGPLCYLRGMIDVVRDLDVYEIQVTCDDGETESFEALNVFVANGRYSGGGMLVSPQALPDDGRVDVLIVRNGEPVEIAALSSRYILADFLEHELIEFRRVRQLQITARQPMPLTADGDDAGETPLRLEVQPHCLRVVVPDTASLLG